MKKIGLCTHFTQTDEWAFGYALNLARAHDWQLTICHWLNSPYSLRRDMVFTDLVNRSELQTVSPALLTKLELQLREYYDCKLGDFTQVAFKLCEGLYQVEVVRCFRQHLLDLVVMGYQAPSEEDASEKQLLENFALHLAYPLVIVGPEKPNQFLLNPAAVAMLDELNLAEGTWKQLEAVTV